MERSVVVAVMLTGLIMATTFNTMTKSYIATPGYPTLAGLKSAATSGNRTAQDLMGVHYLANDVYAKAAYWFQKSAQQGDTSAENHLGTMYRQGLGVQKNFITAIYWYQKSAAQGSADAADKLGDAYSNGQGVPKSYAQAVYWWRKAGMQGNAGAEDSLGKAYYFGDGVPKSYAQVAYWFQKSAAQGDAAAISNLNATKSGG